MPILDEKDIDDRVQSDYDRKFEERAAFETDEAFKDITNSPELKDLGKEGPRYKPDGDSDAGDEGSSSRSPKKKVSYYAKYSIPLAGAAGVGAATIIGFNIYNSGPLQLLHAGQLLSQFHLEDGEDVADSRLTKIWRYLRDPSNPENRRLSEYGKARANRIDARLEDAGYKISHSRSGSLQTLEIDTSKTGTDVEATRAELVESGFNPDNVVIVDGSPVVRIENLNADGHHPIRNTKLLNNVVKSGGYSKVTSRIHSRVLKKRAKVTFNPLGEIDRKITESARARFDDWKEKRKQRVNEGTEPRVYGDAAGQRTEPDADGNTREIPQNEAAAAEIDGAIKNADSPNGVRSGIRSGLKVGGGVTFVVGTGCLLNSIGDAARDKSYENVSLPLIRLAWEIVAAAGQMAAGQEVDIEEVGYAVTNFFQAYEPPSQEDIEAADAVNDSLQEGQPKAEAKGTVASSWVDANDVKTELGEEPTGFDPPPEIDIDGENAITRVTDNIPGLDEACGVLDSWYGQGITFAIDALSGPVSASAGLIASTVLGPPVMNYITNWIAGDIIDTDVAGAAFGSYINYGTRMAANEQNINRGGRPLSEAEIAQWKAHNSEELKIAQSEKPIFDRVFSKTDARSLLSSFARTIPHDKATAITAAVKSPLSVISSLKFLIPSSSTYAQTSNTWDYGFDKYGFSIEELNDERFENPYVNEQRLVDLAEDRGETLQDLHDNWGEKCFGVKITDNENLTLETLEGKKYEDIEEECDGNDDGEMFMRYRFYVLDIMTMKGLVCYDGEEAACAELGNTSSESQQQTAGQTLDGVTCPQNMQPHPTLAGYFQMPEAPNGEYVFEGFTPPEQRYGSETLVCVVYSVALAYDQQYQGQSKVYVGDLNASGHQSHYKGIAVDLDAAGSIRAADHTKGSYSPEATIALGKLFVDTGQIQNIWWCQQSGDGTTEAIRQYAEQKGTPIEIRCIEGHANHFHVDIKDEFALPGSYTP